MPDNVARMTIYLLKTEKAMLERLAEHDKRSASNLIAFWIEKNYRQVFGDVAPIKDGGVGGE